MNCYLSEAVGQSFGPNHNQLPYFGVKGLRTGLCQSACSSVSVHLCRLISAPFVPHVINAISLGAGLNI